jgi:8-amino-7-oxononanoate synthase
MNPVEQYIDSKLQERTIAGNLRTLKTQRAQVDFFSNDYLGIVTNDLLAIDNKRTGATGSRLLSGNSIEAEQLEDKIAAFHNAEAALLFNSGYDANIGLLSSIAHRHSTILYDELCHASIIDGIKLSQSPRQYKFKHNDLTELEKKLKQFSSQREMLVAVESVYSMDGDICPLKEIIALAELYNASIIVDEAHATGVFGKGIVSQLRVEDKVFARVHTFGKALGCHGAVIVGSNKLKQFLINFARPFIYTTALSAYSIEAINKAYDHISQPGFSNKDLHNLISYFRDKIVIAGNANWKDSISPIQVLILGSNEQAQKAAAALQNAGLQINPILHPTVAKGEERLRICLHSFNTKEQVDLIFETLKTAL